MKILDDWKSLYTVKPGNVHVMGICGVGASGVAWTLHLRGWKVSGCDKFIPPLMGAFFKRNGISVHSGHRVEHLDECDVLIYSSAVSADEPELTEAVARGVFVIRRGLALAAWMLGLRSVAIAGTHGKTTTSCFTTRLLQLVGDLPGWCLGGMTPALGTTAGPVNIKPSPDISEKTAANIIGVAEADESDGTLANDSAAVLVITNIDRDHFDYFHDEDSLEKCFTDAVMNTRNGVAVCMDNAVAVKVATCATVPVITYGFSSDAVVRAEIKEETPQSTLFELFYKGKSLGLTSLPVPGRHNVLNALGAFSASLLLDKNPEQLFSALPLACSELPMRRFQWLIKNAPVRVVIDYSHHPVEILAAMSIAKMQNAKRIRVVFQPHRYSRTKALLSEFSTAFNDADEVVLLPVYEASERFVPGGATFSLYEECREKNPNKPLLLARSVEEVQNYFEQTSEEGDLILIIGAGNVAKLGQLLVDGPQLPLENLPYFEKIKKLLPENVQIRQREIMHPSSYGIRSMADVFVEIEDLPTLSALKLICFANKIPIKCLSSGSNTWQSDLGWHGVCFKMKEEKFSDYSRDGNFVRVGAMLTGEKLLERLAVDGLSGLEFMSGIPGKVGGWVKMNAGAFNHAIWDSIVEIKCVVQDGQIRRLPASAFTAGYRSVHGMKGVTVIETLFKLKPDFTKTINEKMDDFKNRRVKLTGLRTCGSVFKNSQNVPPAGALLDALNAKTWRIGKAFVTSQHANIIATENGVTASDILALVQKMQSEVFQKHKIKLEFEVSGFEN